MMPSNANPIADKQENGMQLRRRKMQYQQMDVHRDKYFMHEHHHIAVTPCVCP